MNCIVNVSVIGWPKACPILNQSDVAFFICISTRAKVFTLLIAEKEKEYVPGVGATKTPVELMALPTFNLNISNGITPSIRVKVVDFWAKK